MASMTDENPTTVGSGDLNTTLNNTSWGANVISNSSNLDEKLNVADIQFDKNNRILALAVELVVGLIGGILVVCWLWFNRRRKSRVNTLILNVVISDLLVIIGACAIQLVWEVMERVWLAGHVMCLIVKFFQSFSMMASSNMLVVLSIDRHQAIRSPLRDPLAVWKMTTCGWMLGALLSIPMFFLFREVVVTDPRSPVYLQTSCESVFRERPIEHRQAFLTFISLVHFFIPCAIIVVCYVRIFQKISQKADERSNSKKQNIKPGKIHLTSTGTNSMSKAKIKTLKMTIVIVAAFVLCGLPYHVIEMFSHFGDHTKIPKVVTSVLVALAVANSAVNPYVFLYFNTNYRCLRGLLKTEHKRGPGYYDSVAGFRQDYSANASPNPETTRTPVRMTSYSEKVEMAAVKRKATLDIPNKTKYIELAVDE